MSCQRLCLCNERLVLPCQLCNGLSAVQLSVSCAVVCQLCNGLSTVQWSMACHPCNGLNGLSAVQLSVNRAMVYGLVIGAMVSMVCQPCNGLSAMQLSVHTNSEDPLRHCNHADC
jgi:RecJ-like exonuclease